MNNAGNNFIPALRYSFLTPTYDHILKMTMGDPVFKVRLLEQANLELGETVLDVGCGTGTLSNLIAEQVGVEGKGYGIDLDREILARASKKCEAHRTNINFRVGSATDIPFPNESMDRVFSSLMFHHLTLADKLLALGEIQRVLKPNGQLHIVDWGKPTNWTMRLMFYTVQCLDGFASTRDNVQGALPAIIQKAGFEQIRVLPCLDTMFGTLECFHAVRGSSVAR